MKTLKELVQKSKGEIPDGKRAYERTHGDGTTDYVWGESASDARNITEVRAVKDADLAKAALEAMAELAKGQG